MKEINYEQVDDAPSRCLAPLALTRIARLEPVWLTTFKGYGCRLAVVQYVARVDPR